MDERLCDERILCLILYWLFHNDAGSTIVLRRTSHGVEVVATSNGGTLSDEHIAKIAMTPFQNEITRIFEVIRKEKHGPKDQMP